MTQTPEIIIQTFLSEFQPIAHKFVVLQETALSAADSIKAFVWHPGVYVWVKDNRVIKVGRHLENSRKRALEHLNFHAESNSPKSFKGWESNLPVERFPFDNPSEISVLLFNVVHLSDCHWVAAVEIFMEEALKPEIRSARKG